MRRWMRSGALGAGLMVALAAGATQAQEQAAAAETPAEPTADIEIIGLPRPVEVILPLTAAQKLAGGNIKVFEPGGAATPDAIPVKSWGPSREPEIQVRDWREADLSRIRVKSWQPGQPSQIRIQSWVPGAPSRIRVHGGY